MAESLGVRTRAAETFGLSFCGACVLPGQPAVLQAFSLRTCFLIDGIFIVFPRPPCMMRLWKIAADSGEEETL